MFKLLKTVWKNLSKSTQNPPWYAFSLSHQLVLGEPCRFTLYGSTDVPFRPEHLQFNSPCPGFVLVSEIKLCNKSFIVGPGLVDSICYSKGAELRLSGIEMFPANHGSLICEYTGIIPDKYLAGQKYTFSATFKGVGSIF